MGILAKDELVYNSVVGHSFMHVHLSLWLSGDIDECGLSSQSRMKSGGMIVLLQCGNSSR